MFEDCLPQKRTRRPALTVAVALAASLLFHSAILYVLYVSKGTVKILPLGGKVRTVTIMPPLKTPGPKIVGPLPGGTGGAGPAGAASGPGAGGGTAAPPPAAAAPAAKELPAAQARAASVPSPAEPGPAASEFQRSISSRFKPGGDSGLKITLSPPGSKFTPPGMAKGGPPPDLIGILGAGGAGRGGWGPGPGRSGRGGGGSGQRASLTIPLKGYDLEPWARKVLDIVQRNWALPAVGKLTSECRIGLLVVIKKNGDIASIEILETSSIEILDEAVLRALRASLPFPALPDDFPGDLLETYFEFVYDD